MDRQEIKEQIDTWLREENKEKDWEIKQEKMNEYYYSCTLTKIIDQIIEGEIQKTEAGLCTICIDKDIERVILFTIIKFSKSDSTNYKLSLEKTEFWFDLRLQLIPLGVGINPIPDIDNIEKIQLTKIIYFDGWSRDRFMNDILIMMDATEIVEILFKKFSNYMHDKISKD